MKKIEFDKLELSFDTNYRITYRSNWHGARTKTLEGDSFQKGDCYIEDIICQKRYSYRCLISVVNI